MKLYGLIGFPLSHSFSPAYFKHKFKQNSLSNHFFELYELAEINAFTQLPLKNISGLTVTIPFKEKIIEFANFVSKEVLEIGACNCLKIRIENNKPYISAYNTDVVGFEKSLLQFIGNIKPKALVLGSGGASKAVCFVLKKLDIDYKIVSRVERSNCVSYKHLSDDTILAHKLIINTSPVGMFPFVDEAPEINYEMLTSEHYLFDLVYNPTPSLFLKRGALKSCKIKDGLEMLHFQADAAWDIWTDTSIQ